VREVIQDDEIVSTSRDAWNKGCPNVKVDGVEGVNSVGQRRRKG
jgi:hypothetical protein